MGKPATAGDLPRYHQISNILTERIELGRYAIGDLLPTEQDLCAEFDVSRYTIREALRRLTEAGLVRRRQGRNRSFRRLSLRRAGRRERDLERRHASRLLLRSVRPQLPRANDMYFTSRYSSMPHDPPSRPTPDIFMPPNGACAVEGTPSLIPTMP